MAFYQLHFEQKIPATPSVVWDFIATPVNLQKITPDYMGFHITSPNLPDKIYPGMIITYKVRPILGIPLDWVTEISQVRPGEYFVDEQRVGPYALWHHQHLLEPTPDGKVLMRDIITYSPPLGPLGALANALFIRRQLEGIFRYRKAAVIREFGE